jgi:hypothetical protein
MKKNRLMYAKPILIKNKDKKWWQFWRLNYYRGYEYYSLRLNKQGELVIGNLIKKDK